jgi:regulator of cell morphogenesis and NO signaling
MSFDLNSDTMLSAAAGQSDWSGVPLSVLIAHIVSAHHGYLKLELPRIQRQLEAVYATHRERDAATLAPLPGLLFLMTEDLHFHMQKEENTLFHAIEESEQAASSGASASSSFGTLANPIHVMLAEHENAVSSLEQMRRITRNYELPSHACDAYRSLFQGFEALERDFRTHIHLENDILFPRALALQA